MDIKYIYFDLGGVFFEWDQAFASAAKQFNVQMQDLIDIFNQHDESITKGYLTSNQFWQICRQQLNIKTGQNFNFLESWVSDYVAIPVAHKFARQVSKHYQMGIISNIYQGMFPLLLQKQTIPDLKYQHILLSCDVHLRKPEPEIYLLAQQQADVKPEQILFIDDSQSYLDPARRLGWQIFKFETYNAIRSVKQLKNLLHIDYS